MIKKNLIKTTLATVLLGGLTITGLVLPACSTTPVTINPTSQPVVLNTQQLQLDENLIKTGSLIGTAVYLGSVKDPKSRQSQGNYINQIALALDSTVKVNGSSLTDIENIIGQLIAKNTKSGSVEQADALAIFDVSTALINNQMATQYSQLSPTDQFFVGRSLLDAGLQGIIQSTTMYATNGSASKPNIQILVQ